MNNAEIVEAMKAHHASLVNGLQQHVDALGDDVAAGRDHTASARAVAAFLEKEIYPHAAAEEDAIYPLAAGRERLAALVGAMIDEHRHLQQGAGRITSAPDGIRALGAAQAVSTVFSLHADKENDYILPALAADPAVNLADVLSRMHSLLDEGAEDRSSHEPHGHEPHGQGPASRDSVLDVRPLAPARRHELIFASFDALAPGESFELVNDHDPKPLRYQLAAEHAGEFSWDYLENGPRSWRVRIGRSAAA